MESGQVFLRECSGGVDHLQFKDVAEIKLQIKLRKPNAKPKQNTIFALLTGAFNDYAIFDLAHVCLFVTEPFYADKELFSGSKQCLWFHKTKHGHHSEEIIYTAF